MLMARFVELLRGELAQCLQRKLIEPSILPVIGKVVHVAGDKQQDVVDPRLQDGRQRCRDVPALGQVQAANRDPHQLAGGKKVVQQRQLHLNGVLGLMRSVIQLEFFNLVSQLFAQRYIRGNAAAGKQPVLPGATAQRAPPG